MVDSNIIVIPLMNSVLNSFFKIPTQTENTYKVLFNVCEKYGLLPKDALILASCIEHKIDNLITFDKDFSKLNLKENINIISTAEVFQKTINDSV
ncbi:conserved hypothetical protein [Sulfurihydrogenibium azorense Az-Fu1]|uniref:PIN domain-containing protein n=1 Tax=Sulfurihydrogenibium azorense (strain DSM 15241 / OCM 825 / Az-Fu1) TaxID=204536 RepID=C1DUR7_SULAA|nr:PIN domain-containing protein [Sulfurihydrogenibium azorense]ACN98445.1 conserved hypothetical protein [Sulfurihydrogenibium azorense Az-Fu1]